jgi:hypothetical protein
MNEKEEETYIQESYNTDWEVRFDQKLGFKISKLRTKWYLFFNNSIEM